MKLPVQITFRNMKSSRAVEERIREEVAKLETFYDGLVSCRVTVELPHQHHEHGNLFHIRVDMGVPGEELVVGNEPSLHNAMRKIAETEVRKKGEVKAAHKDVYVALRDAFRRARRELQDYVRRQRGQIKTHTGLATAPVSRLIHDEE